jgi:hypothetical protein
MQSDKFVLKVTAGHSYDEQREIQVNTDEPHTISSDHVSAQIHVRIKDFRGISYHSVPDLSCSDPY